MSSVVGSSCTGSERWAGAHLSQMPGWQEGAALSAQRTLGLIASRVPQSVAERPGVLPAA